MDGRIIKSIAAGFVMHIWLTIPAAGAADIGTDSPRPSGTFCPAPIVFIENAGQIKDPSVRYCFYANNAAIHHTTSGPVFHLTSPQSAAHHTIAASFPGAGRTNPVGRAPQRTRVNFYHGPQKENWQNNVPTFAEVVYPDLYPGVDLHTFGRRSLMKYEFHVAAGADYSQIAVRYRGVDRLFIDDGGSLHIVTPTGELIDTPPYIYQIIDSRLKEIPGRYKLIDPFTYGFEILAGVDPTRQLIIDPELIWSGCVGAKDYDYALGCALDRNDNLIITGETRSDVFYDEETNSGVDIFVAALSPDGELLWTTFLGGSGDDYGFDIALDSADNILLTGITSSPDFPQAGDNFHGETDAFAAKLDATGNLLWAAYLGGDDTDQGFGIAVDSADNIVVAGYTESKDFSDAGNFYWDGSFDGFIAVLDSAGVPQWSAYIGGAYSDHCQSVAVDGDDNYIVTGTSSTSTLPAAVNTRHAAEDAFIAKYDSTGALQWSSYLGGAGSDRGYDVAVTASGRILVTGDTKSNDFEHAINSPHGATDAFVAIADPNGRIVSATYVGGAGSDKAEAICEDRFSNIIIAGSTASDDLAYADNTRDTGTDAFVAALGKNGAMLVSTYLGGGADDLALDLAVDSSNFILVTGATNSLNFTGAEDYHGGARDAFVAKIEGVTNNAPDLIITRCTDELTVIAGVGATVEVQLDNTGAADAVALGPGYFNTTLYISDKPDADWDYLLDDNVGQFKLPALGPGQSHTDFIEFTAPETAGQWYLRARTDDFDSVIESREYNNWGRIISLVVTEPPGVPDLTIAESDETTVSAVGGETAAVSIRIENKGDGQAVPADGAYFFTHLYLAADPNTNWDDLSTDIYPVEQAILNANDYYATDISLTAPHEPGTYYLRAKTDSTGVVEETDEENNWGQLITFDVQPTPPAADLVILGAADAAIYASPGTTVNVMMDIQNTGDANAIGQDELSFHIALYFANHLGVDWDRLPARNVLADSQLSLLGPRQIIQTAITFDAPGDTGDYYLRAKVDDTDVVAESVETNNWGPLIRFVVDANTMPDLMVRFADANDISVGPNDYVRISLDVANMNSRSAVSRDGDHFDTLLFIANEPNAAWDQLTSADSLGFVRIDSLQARERQIGDITFLSPWRQGAYYLRARTDTQNTVVESNEYNNFSRRLRLLVGPPTGVVGASDINLDGVVNIYDYAVFAAAWMTAPGDYRWNPFCDISDPADNSIDLLDLSVFVDNWLLENLPPQIIVPAVWTVAEAAQLTFDVAISDPEGDDLTSWAEQLPPGALYVENVFYWIPDYDSAGRYEITFKAADNNLTVAQTVTITVTDTNRPPAIANVGDKTVNENEALTFTVTALDPDGDAVTYSVEDLPAGAAFDAATFTWTPDYTRAGEYTVTVKATDGTLFDSQPVKITVENINRPPVAHAGDDRTVTDTNADGSQSVMLDATASYDPDDDITSWRWTDSLGAAVAEGPTPTVSFAAGQHEITLIVADSHGAADIDTVTIVVNESLNQPPIADAAGDRTVQDDDADGLAQVTLDASQSHDPDGTIETYLWRANDQFTLGRISVITLPAGIHTIELIVVDDDGASGKDTITVTVNSSYVNWPPVLHPIADPTVAENKNLSFLVTADDANGDNLTYSTDHLPPGAAFTDGLFSFRPWYDQAGIYQIDFTASDGKEQDSQSVTATVRDVPLTNWYRRWLQANNRLPDTNTQGDAELQPIDDISVDEKQAVTFALHATGDEPLTCAGTDLPPRAELNGDIFTWRPWYDQAGIYTLTFTVSNAHSQDTETVDIVVNDVPLANWYQEWIKRIEQD